MATTLARQIQRAGTTSEWAAANPILAAGEFGVDKTLGRAKLGDGVTPWSGLPWSILAPGEVASMLSAADVIASASSANDAVMTTVAQDGGSAFAEHLSATIAAVASPLVEVDHRLDAFKSALDAGRSAAIWFTGDSTLDHSEAFTTGRTMPDYLAQKLAAKYPNHRVVILPRSDTEDKWAAEKVVQAGAEGPRYYQPNQRSLRYMSSTVPQFTQNGGDIDLQILVNMNVWPVSGIDQLITRRYKGASSFSVDAQFHWYLNSSGFMVFRWSADGTNFVYSDMVSSSVPVTVGSWIWLRVTLQLVTGTSYTVKFWTSPDGSAWTQLGSTITASGSVAALYTAASDAFFEIGATGWQPASGALDGKIAEVRIRNGVDGPLMVPANPELWQRYQDVNSGTFGGTPTIRIINAARSSQNMAYHTNSARLAFEAADFGQSVLVFSDSHNDGSLSGEVLWSAPYKAWVEAVQARIPNAAVAVVKQNPHTSAWANESAYGYSHQQRMDELGRLAARNGWSIVDLYAAFLEADPTLATLISADGLHPSAAGYAFSADVMMRRLGFID